MKKHIFGFLLFSFIVASFGLIYAFFYAPSIPPKESVKPPVALTVAPAEKTYTCPTRRSKVAQEIQSAQFDANKNELITKVKVSWNGYGNPPKQLFVRPNLFTLERYEDLVGSLEPQKITDVFKNRSEATLVIISKIDRSNTKLNERENLYVSVDFSEDEKFSSPAINLTEAHEVLWDHGDNPTVKPNTIIRGTRVP
jgi:hypothetical protein